MLDKMATQGGASTYEICKKKKANVLRLATFHEVSSKG